MYKSYALNITFIFKGIKINITQIYIPPNDEEIKKNILGFIKDIKKRSKENDIYICI